MPPRKTTERTRPGARRKRSLQVMLDHETFDCVEKLARQEERSHSAIGARLIKEALEARDSDSAT